MLQVARNLFTHLGEFAVRHSDELANYNYLQTFLEKYKEKVSISKKEKRKRKHRNSNGSSKACKSLPLVDLKEIHVSKSSPHPGFRSLTYFAGQFITTPREIAGSPNSERSHSVFYHKSNVKRRYFSSVYTESEDVCNEESGMENSQLHSVSVEYGGKRILDNEEDRFEENYDIILSYSSESWNSESTETEGTSKHEKQSTEKDSPVDYEFFTTPLQQESASKEEGRNEVEIMDEIQEPVKEPSPKVDDIAAGNDSLLSTIIKYTSMASASNGMNESKSLATECEQSRICVENGEFKLYESISIQEAQLATSGSRSKLDEPFTTPESQKSYYTAKDNIIDDMSGGSQGNPQQEVDMDERDDKSDIFYDTFTEGSMLSSCSEQGMLSSILCRSMMASTPELKWREVKSSHSEPTISDSKNTLTYSQSQFKDSKQCFNYAFIEDVESLVDPLSVSSDDDQGSAITDVSMISARSSVPGRDSKLIVQATAAHDSYQRVPNMSAHSQNDKGPDRGHTPADKGPGRGHSPADKDPDRGHSPADKGPDRGHFLADKGPGRGSGCRAEKPDKDLEYIKQVQPPATDVCIVTKCRPILLLSQNFWRVSLNHVLSFVQQFSNVPI
jgi:hypothetical protein